MNFCLFYTIKGSRKNLSNIFLQYFVYLYSLYDGKILNTRLPIPSSA